MHPTPPANVIRPASIADAAAIVEIIRRAFEEYRGQLQPPSGAHAESVESIAALFLHNESAFLAEDAATRAALGCVFHRPHPSQPDVTYLHRLAVLPEVRGHGIASALIDAVETAARDAGHDYVTLGVRIALPANRAFYIKRGYYPVAYGAHTGFAAPTYVTLQKRVAAPVPRQVIVAPWSPQWATDFRKAADELRAILGESLRAIHHVGSTAIPGMPAKPTIDLLAIVDDLQQVDRTEPRLILHGWQPRGENGIPGRRYFRKGGDAFHTHHLHAYRVDHPHVRRQLAFVAWLKANAEDANRYAALKQALAASPETAWNPAAYTEAKGPLVQEILARALAWQEDGNDAAAP